jgi:uncharacterized membrane protein
MIPNNSTQRLLSIDLARGLAVFFMIAVHTLDVFANEEVKSSLFGQVIGFLGGPPAAPVFMTLMGFSFMFSGKADFKSRIIRGFKIFLSGYILNLFRGMLPFLLAKEFNPHIYNNLPLNLINGPAILKVIDILQFAGLALVIMAIIQVMKVGKYWLLVLSILISILAPFLWGLQSGFGLLDFFLDLLWGDLPVQFSFIGNLVAFPIFPWLSFPLLGMFLGECMLNTKDQNQLFKKFGFWGFLFLSIGLVLSLLDPEYQFNDYYHSRTFAMIFMGGFVVFWIWCTKLIFDLIPDNPVFRLLFSWSKGVTNIYFAQWILIIWSIGLFGINESSFLATGLLILLFSFASHWVNKLVVHYKVF